MVRITLRVLDGADRGRVFDGLTPPITIGREEGNSIQLNDERVSRYHLKIQEDHEKLVLTDLESTNGTKVNGEDIQLRILRLGDMISVGRSVLLVGSREEIAEQLEDQDDDKEEGTVDVESFGRKQRAQSLDFEFQPPNSAKLVHTLAETPPELPERLSPGQAAQLCEILEYIHGRLRALLSSVGMEKRAERVTLDTVQWQSLVDLQSRLADYLRRIGDPEE